MTVQIDHSAVVTDQAGIQLQNILKIRCFERCAEISCRIFLACIRTVARYRLGIALVIITKRCLSGGPAAVIKVSSRPAAAGCFAFVVIFPFRAFTDQCGTREGVLNVRIVIHCRRGSFG
ncbi:hypothetical protein D3C80_1505780 [compost metagenome]